MLKTDEGFDLFPWILHELTVNTFLEIVTLSNKL